MKQKVVIICNGIFRYNSHIERGLGGSELMVQDLAIELVRTGLYDVDIYSYCHNMEGYIIILDKDTTVAMSHDDIFKHAGMFADNPNVRFLELHRLDNKKVDCDIFISSRIAEGWEKVNAKIKIFWAHDAENPDLTNHHKHYNWVITPSNWLRNRHVHKKWSPYKITQTIRHGIYVPQNVEVLDSANRIINGNKIPIDRKKLIFTSVPYKGEGLREAFPMLLKKIDVNMHMYSDIRMYGKSDEDVEENLNYYKKFYGELENNIIWEGTRPRNQLFNDIQDAALMFYPNTFQETFCISILEAMMFGIPVVTTNLAALKEFDNTIKHQAIFGNNKHTEKFVDSAVELLRNSNFYIEVANESYKEAKNYDWSIIILKWIRLFEREEY